MNFETLTVSTDEGICTVTMNRPDRLNAMNVRMRHELGDCFLEIATNTDIRVVVLTGAGKAFSGGGDINDFTGTAEQTRTMMGRVSHRWFRAFWNLPQPVIGAINGAAGGGGSNLALGCDLVYTNEHAFFAQTFMDIGLVPDLGGLFTLPRLIGPARAKEMALLGERIYARQALEMGLINGIFPADQLMEEVYKRARRIASHSPAAVTFTKRIMNRSFETSMDAVLDQEFAAQSALFGTPENVKGVERFLSASAGATKTKKA